MADEYNPRDAFGMPENTPPVLRADDEKEPLTSAFSYDAAASFNRSEAEPVDGASEPRREEAAPLFGEENHMIAASATAFSVPEENDPIAPSSPPETWPPFPIPSGDRADAPPPETFDRFSPADVPPATPVAFEPWRAPAPPPFPAAPQAPVYDRPRYDMPAYVGAPWQAPNMTPKKKKWGWVVSLSAMLSAAVALTVLVVLSAQNTDFGVTDDGGQRSYFWESPSPNTPGWGTDDPVTEPPASKRKAPLDASGDTALDIRDHPDVTSAPIVESGPLSIRQIATKNIPSVVGIIAESEDINELSTGSGIVMTEDGYVLTNNHVVEGYEKITILLNDGQEYQVVECRSDRMSDLAVLKVEARGLVPAEFGNSDQMVIGDVAVVIGCPLGMDLQSTVTNGIISAINRDIIVEDVRMTMLQTNCAINPGNSGGPLINEYGQVVGIISSKIMSDYYDTFAAEGLGFAIPTKAAKPIIDQLISQGYISGQPAIGITGSAVDELEADRRDLPKGLLIIDIHPDCDAAKQGLAVGDVITKVNGQPVNTVVDVNLIKNEFQVGDEITVTVFRPSTRQTMDITFVLMDSIDLN